MNQTSNRINPCSGIEDSQPQGDRNPKENGFRAGRRRSPKHLGIQPPTGSITNPQSVLAAWKEILGINLDPDRLEKYRRGQYGGAWNAIMD